MAAARRIPLARKKIAVENALFCQCQLRKTTASNQLKKGGKPII
jgi:hypothetical protein